MRVLVCGGRDYANQSEVEYQLGGIHGETPITHVIAGAASGADTLAVMWAKDEHIKVTEFPANWKKHGKAAGYIRNKQMLDQGNPELVVAFPGGRGTEMMCKLAEDAGVRVIRVTR
jgi:hypothetical protein